MPVACCAGRAQNKNINKSCWKCYLDRQGLHIRSTTKHTHKHTASYLCFFFLSDHCSNRWMHLCQIFGLSERSELSRGVREGGPKKTPPFPSDVLKFFRLLPSALFISVTRGQQLSSGGKGQNYCLTVVGHQGARVLTVGGVGA